MKLVKAKLSDVASMQKLVKKEVDEGIILHRSDDEIATNIRSYTLAKDGDELVAFSALHIHTIELAEVRSLIVREDLRGKGVGRDLVLALLKEAKDLGLKRVLSLTYQAGFFLKLGFKEIPKTDLPEQKIWADCIKCKLFPICNEVSLIKEI
ncbi:MAG: N-acetyltransferase [Sulfuricurvum sp.]